MRPTLLMITLALFSSTTALHASPTTNARHAIQAAYTSIDTAVAHKDIQGATAFYAPDFTSTDIQGRVTTGAQQQQSAEQVFARAQSISSKTKITAFSLSGPNQATVTAHSHIQITLPAPTATGKTTNLVLDATERDQWMKMADGWRETSDKVLTQSLTANGRLLPKSL
jgi:ketosteroid isomerase-like protein